MRLTKKQKKALSLVWPHEDPPDEEAVRGFFLYTDKGIPPCIKSKDLDELLCNHKQLPVVVEMWKEDFRKGLLFLQDFDTEREALRELAYKVFYDGFGFIPRVCSYRSNFLEKYGILNLEEDYVLPPPLVFREIKCQIA